MVWTFGSSDAEWLNGTQGSDVLVGGGGDDTLYAFVDPPRGSGFVTARQHLADGADLLLGGGGNDHIVAGGGNDYIDGGSGKDTIEGGTGVDIMAGGSGADVFKFEVIYASPGAPSPDTGVGAGKQDVILDFRHGTDHIDLRGWENADHPGATFVGQDDVGFDPALQVGYRYECGNTIVELSRAWFEPDPNQHYDYFGPAGEIVLTGHHILSASDFVF